MGRTKEPTELKVLKGTYRKDRASKNEPQPEIEDSVPKPPFPLMNEAQNFWDENAPMIHESGLLTVVDSLAFSLLADVWGQWKEARKIIAREGNVIEYTDSQGNKGQKIHPVYKIMVNLEKDILSMMREFGMTPASRSKVSVTPKGKNSVNPFARI